MSSVPDRITLTDLTNYLPGTTEWVVAFGNWRRSIGLRPNEQWKTIKDPMEAYNQACAALKNRDEGVFLAGHIMMMCKMANTNGKPVTYSYEGRTITVHPGDNPTAVLDAYKVEKRRRIATFWQSESGQRIIENYAGIKDLLDWNRVQDIRTFTLSNPAYWDTVLKANAADTEFVRALRWGAYWAYLIEHAMELGASLEDIAKPMSVVADIEGYPGDLVRWVVLVLNEVWVHGHQLYAWYNNQAQEEHQVSPLFLPVG